MVLRVSPAFGIACLHRRRGNQLESRIMNLRWHWTGNSCITHRGTRVFGIRDAIAFGIVIILIAHATVCT